MKLGITADEARKLSGIDDAVKDALKKAEHVIRQAAADGKTEVRLGGGVFEGGYGPDHEFHKEYNWVSHYLISAGFNVSFFYKEGSFAVDMGMKVSWGDDET